MKTAEEIKSHISSNVEEIERKRRRIIKLQNDIVRKATDGNFEFGLEQREIEQCNNEISMLHAQILALNWAIDWAYED